MKKIILLAAVCLLASTASYAQTANIYASGLTAAAPGATSVDVSYFLNTNATAVAVNFLDNNGVVKATVPVTNAALLTQGAHTATIPYGTNVPSGTWKWSVTATAAVNAGTDPVQLTSGSLTFTAPRGLAIDNNFESPFFGRIYATGAGTGKPQQGVWIFGSDLSDITTQDSVPYSGTPWAAANTGSSPFRITVAQDGKLYISDWSDGATSGVWVFDPATPAVDAVSVFGGTFTTGGIFTAANGDEIHGSVSACYVEGTGADTKLYTFDEDILAAGATNKMNLYRYDIGNLATPWAAAPSALVYDDGPNGNLQQNGNSVILPDGRGGWWISQYRAANGAAIPSLIHQNQTGTVTNFGSETTLIPDSYQGGMALNLTNDVIALTGSNAIRLLDITFDGAGVPSLAAKYSITTTLSTSEFSVALDAADNVYSTSNTNPINVWALPKADNTFTTPAPAASTLAITNPNYTNLATPSVAAVTISGSDKAVNFSAAVATAQVYDIAGQLVAEANNVTSVTVATAGVYVVKAITATGESAVAKVIVK
ncbi:hypothetical protein FACS1894162_5030 [Bacteroidia bacterium]|nr:hypothetical protein FACS1894162_5030 [Bacteroidia bacterium]